MESIKCPSCGLTNPATATSCTCGLTFQEYPIQQPLPRPAKAATRTALPEIAAVIYLLQGMLLLIAATLQVLLPFFNDSIVGLGGIDLRILGVWNGLISLVFFAIGVFLFRRSKRAYDWGLGTALLNLPLALIGGLKPVNVSSLLGFLLAAILLYKSRGEFVEPRIQPVMAAPPLKSSGKARSLPIVLVLCGLGAFGCVGLAVIGLAFVGSVR